MHLANLPTELLQHVFLSCSSIADVLSLSETCHRFHKIFGASQKLAILQQAAEAQIGPLDEAIQLVTHNDSQAAHLHRKVPFSLALLRQVMAVGRVATRWEEIYPIKKWKHNFEDRRVLTCSERFRVRRAIYRLWLYDKAFHTRTHPRFSRKHRAVVLERAELLHNWSTAELAEMEDVRQIIRDVLQNHVCPSNGTIQRKFRKRFPETDQQLMFNIHLNYPPSPPAPSQFQQQFYAVHQTSPSNKYCSKYAATAQHELGAEGWGDEIPHYYVVEDMLKLDPGQILWLRDNAPLKGQVETFVRGLGEWFENNGETLAPTLEWVVKERGGDVEEMREGIEENELGVVRDANE